MKLSRLLFITLALFGFAFSAACSSDVQGDVTEDDAELGTLTIPLISEGPDGSKFQLTGTFVVKSYAGDLLATIDAGGDVPSVRQRLPAGVHSLELLAGWQVTRVGADPPDPDEQFLLVSKNPDAITIVRGKVTEHEMLFIFRARQGQVELSFRVRESRALLGTFKSDDPSVAPYDIELYLTCVPGRDLVDNGYARLPSQVYRVVGTHIIWAGQAHPALQGWTGFHSWTVQPTGGVRWSGLNIEGSGLDPYYGGEVDESWSFEPAMVDAPIGQDGYPDLTNPIRVETRSTRRIVLENGEVKGDTGTVVAYYEKVEGFEKGIDNPSEGGVGNPND
jgi:hypothetical protein